MININHYSIQLLIIINMLSYVTAVLTEKRKRPRKKDYSETSSAIILCLKKKHIIITII